MKCLTSIFVSVALLVATAHAQDTAPVRDLAVFNAKRAPSDRHALSAIFDDSHIANDALAVHRRAAKMQVEERYKYLVDWVLPSLDHVAIRTSLDFTPTHPAPPVRGEDRMDVRCLQIAAASGQSCVQIGGRLVAPALDLVQVAEELGRLEEVRDLVEQFAPTGGQQQRARLCMLALIATASEQFDIANQHLEQLAELVLAGTHTSFLDREPETLSIAAAAEYAMTRDVAREMAWHILTTQIRKQQPSGSTVWNQHIDSLANRLLASSDLDPIRLKEFARQLDGQLPLANWVRVGYATAKTRGQGLPRASWHVTGDQIRKTSGHAQDYLYYRIPLRGNYEVEFDLTSIPWHTMELMVAGNWVGPWWNREASVLGNFREQRPRQDLAAPLAHQTNEWARYRAVVRDGVCTTYFNGRKLHEELVSDEAEPWLAIRATARSHGAVRDLRISGKPVIPRQINLAMLPELPGWLPYHEGDVGPIGDWQRYNELSADGGILGVVKPQLAGTHKEDLLRYHRPMLEDGTIEYEFYYRVGAIHVHPALDRLAFMLQPDGVRVHWVTDGPFDRTGLAPDNLFTESANRRAKTLPLKSDAWNRLILLLKGDVVDLSLNGKLIFRRELEPTNHRTFGLFHYADRTEARVRNIVWRGDWPRELPPQAKQELAGKETNFLDESLPKLIEFFHHDFAEDGLPARQFAVTAGSMEHFDARADGLRVTRKGGSAYYDTAIGPLLTVGGDFDIVAEFEQFESEPAQRGSGGTYLQVELDNAGATNCILLLRHYWRSHRVKPIIQAAHNDRRVGGVRRDKFPEKTTEATAGRLRLARRGDTLYFLFAENDSPNFRLVGTQTVSRDEPAKVRLVTDSHREGATKVVWKSLTIRADRLAGLAISDQEKVLTNLNKQRDKLPHHFEHDFAQDPLTADRFSHWGVVAPRAEKQGVHVISPGTDNWTSAGLAPQLGLVGDFDVEATFNVLELARPKAGLYSGFYLQLMFSDEVQTHANIIFVDNADGGPQVSAQIGVMDAKGNRTFRSSRLVLVDQIDRFRFARRGKQLSFIYRKTGSNLDEILAQVDIDAGPVRMGNVRLQLHTGGAERNSDVLLKHLRIRAEKIDPVPTDTPGILEELANEARTKIEASPLFKSNLELFK